MHEPIISEDLFGIVQKGYPSNHVTKKSNHNIISFNGIFKCADCGKTMTRDNSSVKPYYVCMTYKKQSKFACSRHAIRNDKLETIVLEIIKKQINLVINISNIIEEIQKHPSTKTIQID